VATILVRTRLCEIREFAINVHASGRLTLAWSGDDNAAGKFKRAA